MKNCEIKNKKVVSLFLAIVMIFSITGCGSDSNAQQYDVICVDYASYSWVTGMLSYGDIDIDVVLLNDEGVDVHSFEPSVEDIAMMKEASLIVCMGGTSESWIDGEMFQSFREQDDSSRFISMMDFFMTSSYYTTYEDRDDEHIWSSLGYAIDAADILKSAIEETVLENANKKTISEFEESVEGYVNDLTKLKNAYENMNPKKPVVIADRNPFYYLLTDAGIDFSAAFEGCSAETEASFETITELAKVVDDNELDTVLYLENFTGEIPDILASVVDASERLELSGDERRSLYTLDANFPDNVNLDTSYIGLMWTNYYTLAEATDGNTEPEM